MKKYIVITTINDPSVSIKKFSELSDWNIVVVGDKKTPLNWSWKGVTYLSPLDQKKLNLSITKILPWNHYSRKMVGYLYCISQGAEVIADSDDDNIPLKNWGKSDFTIYADIISGPDYFNIYKKYTKENIWPRGYPIDILLRDDKHHTTKGTVNAGVIQYLANNNPDVDAIYRLTHDKPIFFSDDNKYIALDKGTVCPINSQNTIFTKKTFPLLYLPAFVSFRMTDIMRGLVMQPILWSLSLRAVFGPATAIQERNEHNIFKDFSQEVEMYLNSKLIVEISKSTTDSKLTIPENLLKLYIELEKNKIVQKKELILLKSWINDLSRYD